MNELLSDEDFFGPASRARLLSDEDFFGVPTTATPKYAPVPAPVHRQALLTQPKPVADTGEFMKGIHGGYRGAVSTMAGGMAQLAESLGAKDASVGLEAAAGAVRDDIRDYPGKHPTLESVGEAKGFGGKAGALGDYIAYNAGQGVGSSIPVLATTVANPVAGAAAAYDMGLGEMRQAQRDAGATPDALTTYGLAVPYAAVEAAGAPFHAGKKIFAGAVREGVKGAFRKRVAGEVAKTALGEFTAEGVQEGLNTTAGALASDQPVLETLTKPENIKRIAEAGVAGAVGGGPFGVISAIPGPAPTESTGPTEQAKEAPQAPEQTADLKVDLESVLGDERTFEEIKAEREAMAANAPSEGEDVQTPSGAAPEDDALRVEGTGERKSPVKADSAEGVDVAAEQADPIPSEVKKPLAYTEQKTDAPGAISSPSSPVQSPVNEVQAETPGTTELDVPEFLQRSPQPVQAEAPPLPVQEITAPTKPKRQGNTKHLEQARFNDAKDAIYVAADEKGIALGDERLAQLAKHHLDEKAPVSEIVKQIEGEGPVSPDGSDIKSNGKKYRKPGLGVPLTTEAASRAIDRQIEKKASYTPTPEEKAAARDLQQQTLNDLDAIEQRANSTEEGVPLEVKTARGRKTSFEVEPTPEAVDHLRKQFKGPKNEKRFYSRHGERLKLSDSDKKKVHTRIAILAKQLAPQSNVKAVESVLDSQGEEVAGSYSPMNNLIKAALTYGDPETTVRHEAVHALKSMGLFTDPEWNLLSKEARRNWVEKHKVSELYDGLSKDQKIEEAIAQEFAGWNRGEGKHKPGFRKVFNRIKDFFTRLANVMRGLGHQTVDDVFERVESGEVGKRNPSPESDTETRYALKPDARQAKRFTNQLDQLLRGNLNTKTMLSVGQTPPVLVRLGANNVRLLISQKVIRKVAIDKHDVHTDVLAHLPELVADPVMVVESATRPEDSLVVVLDAEDINGHPLVASVFIGDGTAEINAISSIYGQQRPAWFPRQLNEGRMKYVNKKKGPDWARRTGVQFPGWNQQSGPDSSMLSEADFVNESDTSDETKHSRFTELPVVIENRKRAETAIDAVKNNRFLASLSPLGRLPAKREYLKKRYLTLGKVAKIDEIAGKVYQSLVDASKTDQKAVYDYLTTKDATPTSIENTAIRRSAIQVKKMIDRVGKSLVERGLLSVEVYEAHADSYLPRVYLKHILGEGVFHDIGTGKRPSSMGYLKARKDIDEETRMLILGEVMDPAFLGSKGIAQPLRDLAILDFLDEISGKEEWIYPDSMVEWKGRNVSALWLRSEASRIREQAQFFDDPARQAAALEIAKTMNEVAAPALEKMNDTPDDYKQVPDQPRYGMLRGMFVRKEIHDDLIGTVSMLPHDRGIIEQFFEVGGIGTKITQLWKLSKVALNPPTQIRNIISNGILLHLSGVPFHRVPDRVIQAVDEMRNNGKYWQVAQKYGVTASNFVSAELHSIHKELIDLKARHGGAKHKIMKIASIIGEKAGNVYQLSEGIFKTAKIIDAMEREGMDEGDAAMAAQDALFDYSLVPPGVRYLRNSPFGVPFITFYYKALPAMLKVAVKAPWRFAPYAALSYALPAAVASMYDVDDEDVDRLRKALPKWLQDKGNAYLLPHKDEKGRWQAVDLGYFFPWSMAQEVYQEASKGEVGSAVSSAGLFGGPITDLAIAIKTNIDPFTKRPIANPADPPQQQVKDILTYLWRMAAPSWVTDHGVVRHMYKALTDTPNEDGSPGLTTGQASLRALGINIYPILPEQERVKNIRHMEFEMKEMKRRLRQIATDQSISKQRRDEIVKDRANRIAEKARQIQQYAKESGVHPNLSTGP